MGEELQIRRGEGARKREAIGARGWRGLNIGKKMEGRGDDGVLLGVQWDIC